MSKINVYGLDGTIKEQITLPKVFTTTYRPDIIKKSFEVTHSNQRQPYGSDKMAGKRHAVASVGKGQGRSRVPRLTQGQNAALAPNVVGGRRAHPPKAEHSWKEKMNKKEQQLARNSALAATADKTIVTARGHHFKDDITLPIIIDDDFDNLTKVKDVVAALNKIGIYADIERAQNGHHVRAGKGKMRGRRYRTPTSILIVSTSSNAYRSSKNLIGVDVTMPTQLNIELLAPGGTAGRLTLITKSALHKLGGAK
jgi:large subunit ribosomal protein L4e